MDADKTANGRKSAAGGGAVGLAALGSLLAASSCCLPLLPFAAAAGAAGGAGLFLRAQPYLLAASLALIALGFHQARRAKKCNPRKGAAARLLLWAAAAFVALTILFPDLLANTVADLVGG
jgi:hypothetical protein